MARGKIRPRWHVRLDPPDFFTSEEREEEAFVQLIQMSLQGRSADHSGLMADFKVGGCCCFQ